jgi:hypothetical protein
MSRKNRQIFRDPQCRDQFDDGSAWQLLGRLGVLNFCHSPHFSQPASTNDPKINPKAMRMRRRIQKLHPPREAFILPREAPKSACSMRNRRQ